MTPTFTSPELKKDDHAQDAAEGPLLFPCTPPQERCWFLEKLKPGNTSLNVAVRWEIRGKIDASTIEQTLRTIIQRHEILRTRLVDVDGAAMQEVMDGVEFKLSVIDLTNLPEADRATRAAHIHEEESKRPFDLSKAPLIRATAIRTAPDRTLLLVLIHQVAFDGWSIRVLGREVGQCIAALEAKRPANLPDLPLQYGDYALWQQEFFACSGFEAEKTYWQKQLARAPYFEIETDHPRGATRTHNGAMVTALLPFDAGERLEAAAKAHGVSMFNISCAVIAALLHRVSGENDIIFGTQVAGRDDVDLESLIGVFINNLVLRMDASGDPTFREFLTRAEETVRGALMHQKLPFHRLVELLNPPRDMSRTPLIAINVILQRAFLENTKYDTFELLGIPSPSPGAFYDLNFQMVGRPEGWRMALEYNTDLFDRRTAQDIIDGWKAALEAVSADTDVPLSKLPAPALRPKHQRAPQGPYAAICQALQSHPDVGDADVISTDKGVYAYVEPSAGTRAPLESMPQALMTHMRRACPDDHRLTGISVLLKLPRDAHGNLDAAALPSRTSTASVSVPAPAPAKAPGFDALLTKVAKIWAEVLDVTTVAPEASFFALGGHSLLAVRMLLRVEDAFGRRIALATLFGAPVLREFVAELAAAGFTAEGAPQEASSAASPAPDATEAEIVQTMGTARVASLKRRILHVKKDGEKTPIIAINNTADFNPLVHHLCFDRPFVDIQFCPSWIPQDLPTRHFGDIARDAVEMIRLARPRGPYILMGLCLFGAVAFEAAQQLRQEGEDVPLVILCDTRAPGSIETLPWAQKIERQWVVRIANIRNDWNLYRTGQITLTRFLSNYRLLRRSGLIDLALAAKILEPNPEGDILTLENRWFTDYLARCVAGYRPASFDGNFLLFRSSETRQGRLFDHAMGWGGIVKGKFRVATCPAKHAEMFHEHGAKVIAEETAALLAEIEGEIR